MAVTTRAPAILDHLASLADTTRSRLLLLLDLLADLVADVVAVHFFHRIVNGVAALAIVRLLHLLVDLVAKRARVRAA